MLKKFIEGLVFGSGFTISFVAIWYIAALFVWPTMIGSQMEEVVARQFSEHAPNIPPSESSAAKMQSEPGKQFHELGLEEQIKKASVIALAKYELAPDGKMKAIFKEFLKKEANVTIYYNIGDEFPSSSYCPKENTSYGDGIVIFFTGSPATMRMSMTYSGGRIHSLGDLPVELLRDKCKEPNA